MVTDRSVPELIRNNDIGNQRNGDSTKQDGPMMAGCKFFAILLSRKLIGMPLLDTVSRRSALTMDL